MKLQHIIKERVILHLLRLGTLSALSPFLSHSCAPFENLVHCLQIN